VVLGGIARPLATPSEAERALVNSVNQLSDRLAAVEADRDACRERADRATAELHAEQRRAMVAEGRNKELEAELRKLRLQVRSPVTRRGPAARAEGRPAPLRRAERWRRRRAARAAARWALAAEVSAVAAVLTPTAASPLSRC
jgi:hypothetical protein